MAGPYGAYPPHPVYDEGQRPDHLHGDPYDYHGRERTPERPYSTERPTDHEHEFNSEENSFSSDSHSHHHHHRHSLHASDIPPLAIRRHRPGTDDPSLQTFPTNLQPSSTSDNRSLPSNVRVTIKRHPIMPDQPFIQPGQPFIQPGQPFIQPIIYPVPVYMHSPVPPNFDIQQIQPIKEITKPPSPKKPVSPVKKSHIRPVSSNSIETESFPIPPSRNAQMNVSPRRPVRVDSITPTPPKIEPQLVRPAQVIVEEYDDYNDYYRVPSVYTIPKKVISYRTAAGMTTRELENERIDDTGRAVYIPSREAQTVTYRTS